jgi:hypothetical protein
MKARSAIGGISRLTVDAAFGACADDVAAALAKMRQRIFGHQESRFDIAPDLFVEFFDGHVVGLCIDEQNAGIVDEHIEPPETIDGFPDAGARLLVIGDVGGECNRIASVVSNCSSDVLDGIFLQAINDNLCAFMRKFVTDRFTDPGSAAGHDCNFAFKFPVHGSS